MASKLRIPVLRTALWPACDRRAWDDAYRSGGWFDESGALARYPLRRRRVFESAYGRWLGFLQMEERFEAEQSGLPHLEDRHLVQAFYEQLEQVLAPYTVRNHLADLVVVVRAMAPDHGFALLRRVTRYTWRHAKPAQDKRARIVPIAELNALGFELMAAADAERGAVAQAATFRDGLMITMLASEPVRRGNLASIEIGRHLERHGEHYWLSFAAHEVKNRRPIEARLPAKLTGPIDHYTWVRRPVLLEETGRWQQNPGHALWISSHGSRLKPRQVWERICRRTAERFGHPINPHLFRDCAATSIAIEDPEHVGIIQPVLGHSNIRTGERYYNQARSLQAARRYQDALEQLRNLSPDR